MPKISNSEWHLILSLENHFRNHPVSYIETMKKCPYLAVIKSPATKGKRITVCLNKELKQSESQLPIVDRIFCEVCQERNKNNHPRHGRE
jgi:hypothetical protein